MKHRPYSLYKKQTKKGKVWYVRFWNAGEQRYSLVRSTGVYVTGKKGRYQEAEDEARRILHTLSYSPTNKTVAAYLADFWQPDGFDIQERDRLKKKPLSKAYIKSRQTIVRLYIKTYPLFAKLPVVELTSGSIKDWMIYLSKKGILKPEEVKRLITHLTDRDTRIAVLLGVLCGMHLGEVRGLRYEDIDGAHINIQRNYQDLDGEKDPKSDSRRVVFMPAVLKSDIGAGEEYIFKNRNKKAAGKPSSAGYFRKLFIQALGTTGIDEEQQKKRFLSFHSLRHTFVTLGRSAGISDMDIRALAGHKSPSMTERYSHAAEILNLENAREKLKSVIDG